MSNGPGEQPPYGNDPYGQPPYGQGPHGQNPYQAPHPQPTPPPYGQQQWTPTGALAYGVSPTTPYGIHPVTGVPYSDKSKVVAGLLQILVPLGIGRFYTGYTGLGVAQLVVTLITCGIGALWPFIDGIIMLATDSVDSDGRLLRS